MHDNVFKNMMNSQSGEVLSRGALIVWALPPYTSVDMTRDDHLVQYQLVTAN